MNSLCERPCRRAPAFTHSQFVAEVKRSRRDFKEQRAFLMAEERWSMAVAKSIPILSARFYKSKIK
jgi:hypothetical protein